MILSSSIIAFLPINRPSAHDVDFKVMLFRDQIRVFEITRERRMQDDGGDHDLRRREKYGHAGLGADGFDHLFGGVFQHFVGAFEFVPKFNLRGVAINAIA